MSTCISADELEVTYDPSFWKGKPTSDLQIWFEGNPVKAWKVVDGVALPLPEDTIPSLNTPKRIPIEFHPGTFDSERPQMMQTHIQMPE